MKKIHLIMVLLMAVAALAGIFVAVAGQGADSSITADTSDSVEKKKVEKTILFFINPNGMPCQMQDRILTGMMDQLNGKASVKYIKTTVAEDRADFAKWGIRGLPMLIIVDKSDKVLKRFTPGIQSEQVILDALK
jgi:thioredoxin 1